MSRMCRWRISSAISMWGGMPRPTARRLRCSVRKSRSTKRFVGCARPAQCRSVRQPIPREIRFVPLGPARFYTTLATIAVMAIVCHAAAHAGAPVPGEVLARNHCGGCHGEHDGTFERISSIRKTPEGWVMTLFRMRQVHGLVLTDEVRESIVRYLADTGSCAGR